MLSITVLIPASAMGMAFINAVLGVLALCHHGGSEGDDGSEDAKESHCDDRVV